MKRSIISCIFLFALIFTFQNTVNAQGKDITKQDLRSFGKLNSMVPTRSAKVVTGTPYLTEQFLKGKIILNSHSTTKALYIRFNTNKNQVEFVRGKKIMVTDPNKIDGFNILTQEGKPIIFKNGFHTDIDDISGNTLLRIIHEGKIKLLAHHGSTLLKNLASYGSADEHMRYQSYVDYYLVIDGKFHKVKLSEKNFLNTLGDHKSDLKNYANSNHLSFKNFNDLDMILNHYEKIAS